MWIVADRLAPDILLKCVISNTALCGGGQRKDKATLLVRVNDFLLC